MTATTDTEFQHMTSKSKEVDILIPQGKIEYVNFATAMLIPNITFYLYAPQ